MAQPQAQPPSGLDFDADWEIHSERDGAPVSDPPVPTDEPAPEPEPAPPDPPPTTGQERTETGQFKKSAKPRHNPQARVAEATIEAAEARKRYEESQARIKTLEDKLQLLKKPQPKPSQPDPTRPKPKIEDFYKEADPLAAYTDAIYDWKEEQREAKASRQKTETEFRERFQRAASRMDEARKEPEFKVLEAAADAAVARAGFMVPDGKGGQVPGLPPALLTALADSPKIVALTRYFGAHPEILAQRIREYAALPLAAVTVVQQAIESLVPDGNAGTTESAPPAPAVSKAKPPITRVGGGANATPVSEDEESFEDFVRRG